ncbi:MAG: N-acetylmuramic acid 6-phosphate etherase [Cytophagales bacterium]|nr:N-acetylmuramic acid 6-phosphate etherase [Cytophagales bacterium]
MNVTETGGTIQNLEALSVSEILFSINEEDHKVPQAVREAIPQIEKLAQVIIHKLLEGGRLFYIGAGTSGRLGIVDASECPPTYGVPHDMVVGLIAGGDGAIRKAVEFAEDDITLAWKDLLEYHITNADVVVGIAASGKTPYVLGGLQKCNENGIVTGSICCNPGAPVSSIAKYPIEVVTGPEIVRGSTRMKAGTAQKLVLNMLTTTVMIKLGKIKGNKMVDMQLSNHKLVQRGISMIMEESNVGHQVAEALLKEHGSVRKALESLSK